MSDTEKKVGWTLYDFLHYLSQKLNSIIIFLVFAAVIFFSGWFIAHLSAKPGTEISVWGGLIQYVKDDKESNSSLQQVTLTPTPTLAPSPTVSNNNNDYIHDKVAEQLKQTINVIANACNAKIRTFSTLIQESFQLFFQGGYTTCRKIKVHNYLVSLSDAEIRNLVRYVCSVRWLPKEHITKKIEQLREEINNTPYIGTKLKDQDGNISIIERDKFGRIIYPSNDFFHFVDGEEATSIQKFFYRQGDEFKKKFFIACDAFIEYKKIAKRPATNNLDLNAISPPIIKTFTYQGKMLSVTKRVAYDSYKAFVNSTGWNIGEQPHNIANKISYISPFSAIAYAEWLSEITGLSYRIPSKNELEILQQFITEPLSEGTYAIPDVIREKLQQEITEEICSDSWGIYSSPYYYRFFRLIQEG
ncbi:hypothetical protein GF339_00755 [candidate division KSB3 bacterium]|uniref:Uncharacterized protein n=1 Tax=candidate division KSB3 bacterium TaxID=2044937 RepID=A0A9D5JRY7_9BACT|nr:hypothetical protein [candidate division KSB3 bacterium]MBD3323078.1 hypothetical protein [candidate division KSB3 bacterium]